MALKNWGQEVVQDIDELMDSLNHFNPFHRMG
jgi:hypothetical protein